MATPIVLSFASFTLDGRLRQTSTRASLSRSSCMYCTLQRVCCLCEGNRVTGSYLMAQNGTDEYRTTFRDARCQLVSRYAASDENERKQVFFWMNAETIVGCSWGYDGGYVCRLEGCSRKLCEDCPMNLPNPVLSVRELPRKQSFGQAEWPLCTSCWSQTSRNEFAIASGFRTSLAVHPGF